MTLLYVTGVDNKVYDLSESLFLCLYKVDIINSAYTYMNNISCTMDAFGNGTANGTYQSNEVNYISEQQQYEFVYITLILFLGSLIASLLGLRRRRNCMDDLISARARACAHASSEQTFARAPLPSFPPRGGEGYK